MNCPDMIALVLKSKPSHKVLSISPNHTVHQAIEKLAEFDVGALLVLSDDKLVGILSERDYARKGILIGHDSRQTLVRQMMTSPVISVTPQHTVDECMAIMTEHHVRHLPVIDNDAVIGLISIGDLVKWVISSQANAIQELQGYIKSGYPG